MRHNHMISPNVVIVIIGVALLWLPPAAAQDAVAIADTQIIQEIRDHNQLMDNLEYLSDIVGPRVTGTEQLKLAVNWARELCDKYKLDNVHLEGWEIARSWHRGSAQGQIVSPVVRSLTVASAGWSPSTAGQVRGKVVYVPAARIEDLQAYRGKLRGAIVIYQ